LRGPETLSHYRGIFHDADTFFFCFKNQKYRDALDAYSRAIRLNPYISEVWYDLGTLYESCNNQMQDALDAYQRAADLDPNNAHIRQRLELLRKTNGVTATIG
jgi:cytochrome c-type biogenesis protein CcmH/NrfG